MSDERPDAQDDVSGDDKIVREAKKRFRRCQSWESTARTRWIEDEKFANGDSDNLYQWPDATLTARGYNASGTGDQRPCLTINKTHQHNLQIINDARQNRTHIKYRPVGNGATFEASQVLDGIARHIEYISNAQQVYATATRHQVQSGIGYWRVMTQYVSDDSFEQEIVIKRVKNPLTIYVDPDFQEADGSDMRFGFVFEDMPKDEFDAQYPDLKDMATNALDNEEGWITEDHVRIAEYFRRDAVKDQLVAFKDPNDSEGDPVTIRRSEMNRSQWRALMADILKDPDTQTREVIDHKIHWYKIAGDKIIEDRPWPGRYVPIVRVPGEETIIDGELDRKGHTRALKDMQRMLNYNASGQAETVGLQTKAPWMASAAAIEGYETYWSSINTANYAVVPYNHMDDEGNELEAPRRVDPPTPSEAFQIGMQTAEAHMMSVSGQYQADFGAPGNERSGVAIQQRQRQGATATYHFIDHLAMAVRFTAKIILDLIPHVYDTKRVIKIMAEDGSDSEVLLDPNAAQAYFEKAAANENAAKQVIFNPNIGRYDVIADVGPDFATRRQEAYNALVQILGSNPDLIRLIGDLMFKSADFEYADQIAQRLERLVPAEAKGEGPNPQVVQLQQQVQALGKLIETLSMKLQKQELDLKDKSAKTAEGAEQKIIDAYKAETERLGVFKDFLAAEPEAALALVRQVVSDAMNTEVVTRTGMAA